MAGFLLRQSDLMDYINTGILSVLYEVSPTISALLSELHQSSQISEESEKAKRFQGIRKGKKSWDTMWICFIF